MLFKTTIVVVTYFIKGNSENTLKLLLTSVFSYIYIMNKNKEKKKILKINS